MSQRVLVVSNLYPPQVVGGAEIVAHRQARLLRASGREVAVLAGGFPVPAARPGTLGVEASDDGTAIYRLAMRSLDVDENFHDREAGRRLLSVIATFRPDIVHMHNLMGLGANLIPVAKRAGAKVVVTLHDHWGYCFKSTLLRNDGRVCDDPEQCGLCRPRIRVGDGVEVPIRVRRDYVAWCLDQADALLAPSRYLAAAYEQAGVVRQPVAVVSNGIDLEPVAAAPRPASDTVRFACFSHIGEHKGIPTLLEAAERLAQDAALAGRWHLTIAGGGHLGPALDADIARGRFGGAVTYKGRVAHAEALALMADCDVAVLASVWPENEPVALLEAIAAGKAQVASRIGGNPELVDDGCSGLLFTPGSVDELACALRRLVTEPGLARTFGQYNADRREAFREQRTIDRLCALYDALPARAPADDDFVVICIGARRPERFDLLLHRLHVVEPPSGRLRIIWHEWACASVWRAARLLWLWDDDAPTAFESVARALRSGLALLVPEGSIFGDVAREPGVVGTFASPVEAAALLTAASQTPDAVALARDRGPSAARRLNALAPREAFGFALADQP